MQVQKMTLVGMAVVSLLAFRDAGSRNSSHKRFFHRRISGDVSVVVLKESYELKVYDQDGWYATYPVVFGSKSLDDKMMEGDRKTPEGVYHIASKRPHEKWDKMMLIDFPTQADMDKFKERKAKGLIQRMRRSEAVLPSMVPGRMMIWPLISTRTGRMVVLP